MDYRLYILAGTFLLLIVAIVTFFVTLARSRRAEEPMGGYAAAPAKYAALPPANARVVHDNSLAGLEVPVAPDAPSAALLTPLRTGEWMPPERPAPAEKLPDISLAERVAEFAPAPSVPEPAFSVEAYPAWQVTPDSLYSAAPAGVVEVAAPNGWAPVGPAPAPPAPAPAPPMPEPTPAATQPAPPMPEPTPAATQPAPVMPEPTPAATQPAPIPRPATVPYVPPVIADGTDEDDFSAELAALMPPLEPDEGWSAAATPPPASIPQIESASPATAAPATLVPEVVPVVAPTPESAPVVVSPAEWPPPVEPAWPLELPVAAPTAVTPPASSAAAPAPLAPVSLPAPAAPASEPSAPAPAPLQTQPPLATPPQPQPQVDEAVWEDLLREQQGVRRPAASAPQPVTAPRPAATVAATEPPRAEPTPPPPVSAPRRERPRARVRVGSDTVVAPTTEHRVVPAAPRPADTRRPEGVPELVMAAPVEMWFGEYRVGVKAGTATYDRFRKYADVLLADLKASRTVSR